MTQTPLSYGIESTGQETVVRFHGGLDFSAHPLFRTLLADLKAQPAANTVIFDISAVSAIDPAGLGLILIARRYCQQRGLKLRNPSPDVAHVLTLTGFDAMVPICG